MKKLFKAVHLVKDLAKIAWAIGQDVVEAVRGKRRPSRRHNSL